MHFGLTICLKKGSLNGNNFIQLFNSYISFIPEEYDFNDYDGNWKGEKTIKKILNASYKDYISVNTDYEKFTMCEIDGNWPYQMIEIIQQIQFQDTVVEEILSLYKDNLICAYQYNDDYVKQQGLTDEMGYKIRDIPLSKSLGIPHTLNDWGQKEFDITDNFGQKYLLDKFTIIAAWKIWFTDIMFEDIDKSKILKMDFAEKIKQDGEITSIQLFENPEHSERPDNREKQKRFLETINNRILVKKYKRH